VTQAPSGSPGGHGPGGLPGPVEEAVAWVRAVALGLGDTLSDMLAAGRKGAQETTDRYWARFDRKTRRRREPK